MRAAGNANPAFPSASVGSLKDLKVPKYLTLEETAERLGVDYKTVYRLVRTGEISAGKIGRIYRVREEDIDAYFERQKRQMAEQTRRLRPLEGLRCGACGKEILSELSVAGACRQCGKEICPACWSIRKVRACATHAAAAAEVPPPARRRRTAGRKPAAAAEEKAEDRGQVIDRLRAEGKPVVTAAEGRLAEEAFIRSFGQRLERIEELPEPLSGRAVVLRRARVKHEIEARFKGNDSLPLNRISRFILRTGGWGKPRSCLVLEARFACRPEVIESRGYDADPMTEGDLTPVLHALAGRGRKGECFHVAAVASPTGWTRGAISMIAERNRAKAFHDKRAAVALVDLHADTVHLDESDERLFPFWPVLAPQRWEDEVERCARNVREILQAKNSLSLADAVRACKAHAVFVRAAFDRLEREGAYAVDELDDIGLVISRLSP